MEIGISSFGEVEPEHQPGGAARAAARMKQLLEEIVKADEGGLDVYALGEHHRADYLVSSPEMILSAAAARTKNIRLSSSVTVLSSADPVRIFQQFATLDLISEGRAEIMAGRGSFIESFPLFGYDLDDYDELFVEKLDLLLNIRKSEVVDWRGRFRSPIQHQGVYPRPLQQELPVWQAVGGTPASAKRAGTLGLPMMVALLGGKPEQFVPLVQLFRKSAADAGHAAVPLGINSHFYVAPDSDEAADDFFPTYEKLMNKIGSERGWAPLSRDQFNYLRKDGPLLVGNARELTDKIIRFHGLFGMDRYLAQFITGPDLPHEKVLRSIDILSHEIAPAVKKAVG